MLDKIDTLTRWQRMRFVSLAVACGAKPEALRLNKIDNGSDAEASTCKSCGVDSSKGVHVLRLDNNVGRSLVDKHYDSIAQATMELGIPGFSAALPNGTGGDMELHFSRSGNGGDKEAISAPSSLCLLCEIAQRCNAATLDTAAAAAVAAADKKDGRSSCWWWENKFDPNFIDMDTGDIGGVDPVDEIICRPLSMWAENCRYVLGTAAGRVAAQEKHKLQQQEEETRASAASFIKRLESISSALMTQQQTASFTFADDGDDGGKLPTVVLSKVSPQMAAGYNRSIIKFSDTFKSTIAFLSALKTPQSLTRFLTTKMQHIALLVLRRGLDPSCSAPSADEEEEEEKKVAAKQLTAPERKLLAAFFFYIFSDVRRRQANSAQQQNPMMAGGGTAGAGGMMAMLPGISAPGGTDTSALLAMLGGGGGGGQGAPGAAAVGGVDDRVAGMSSMLAAMQASALQQQQQQNVDQEKRQQQQAMIPPPFPLPLSLLEEMLIVHGDEGGALVVGAEMAAVRKRVEVDPFLPTAAVSAVGAGGGGGNDEGKDLTEDEREELELEMAMKAAANPPSYGAELGAALIAAMKDLM